MHHSRQVVKLGIVLLVIGLLPWVGGLQQPPPPVAAAHTIPVTVTITRVVVDPDDNGIEDPLRGPADLYAGVDIGGLGVDAGTSFATHVDDAENIQPFWVFTRNILIVNDAAPGTVPVTIEVWDHDECDTPFCTDTGLFESNDDKGDVKPGSSDTLLLNVNLADGTWTGNVSWPANCAQGEGANKVRVCWDISIVSPSGDADGDGLLDGWETNGLDADGDGTIDVNLPSFGANPLHKDLFLEFDWVNNPTNQAPTRAAIQALKGAFAVAPINAGGTPNNPDGQPGINLWVDTGNLTDPTASEDGAAANSCSDGVDNGGGGGVDAADPDCLVGDNLGGGNGVGGAPGCLNGNFYAVKTGNFNAARSWVFRYGISGDPADNNPCNGGRGEIGGNDFIEFNHDGGTIMHEFGHTLNLRHGGNVNDNCKPNYVSAMNYDNQFGINQAGGGIIIDYSPPRFAGGRGAAPLPNLVENSLNEGTILDGTDATNRFVFVDGTGAKVQSALNQAVDWNGDGDTGDGGPLTVNIDTSGTNGRPGACTNGGSSSTLGGHHDWNVIALNFRGFGDSADGAINPFTDPEPDLQELLDLQEELNTTDLELAKSDSVDPAIAGAQLVYTLTVTNHGPNPASKVHLADVLPAGVSYVSNNAGCVQAPAGTVTCDLGQLLARASTQVSITVFIARDLVHNAGSPVTITNNASVANLAGPDADDTNNAASETTLVKAVADLDIVSFAPVNPPGQMLVGQNVDITLRKIITNHGPSAPMDVELTRTAAAPPDSTVTPSAPPPVMQPALGLDELRTVNEVFTIRCSQPSPHTFTFTNEIQPFRDYSDPALPDDADPNQANNHAQVVLQIECVVPVAINIHPGSFPNSVNPGKAGNIPVAVLTTAAGEYGLPLAFNAQTIDPLSVRFDKANGLEGGYNAAEVHNRGHLEDSIEKLLDSQGRERTRDGDLDMVLHFEAGDTSIGSSTTQGCVKGEWVDAGGGVHKFFGCDSVNAVPK